MIPIPDSVAFYWGDAINQAAINVLGGSLAPPGDLTLAEAERFERANLAARRVWLDYAGMLRALWAASWEPAVRAHFPGAKLLTYAEQSAFSNEIETLADPSVEHAWQRKAVAGVFELGRTGRLFTRVGLTNGEREGELQFYLYGPDQTCAVTDALDLGPDWGDDGDNRRVTRAGLLVFARDGRELDPAHLAKLALGAVAALAAALV
ncbi:hypothetical protein MKK70_27340 [Methylobacterium sp. E-041]|uniref:hypothetical protein n=1 Tax=Methylobacterium sp. E-041 TaxID=2836573 RepID=UPI001FB9582B|nr:hypothetical protein [Methylobacterium sp. E-041]MCJ2109016.1 hypothetical protein [Methylobacterium sp. E-041]